MLLSFLICFCGHAKYDAALLGYFVSFFPAPMHIHIPYGVSPLFRESRFCDSEKMREIDDFLSVNITVKVICTIYVLGCKSSVIKF
jgi:hypothetical protein